MYAGFHNIANHSNTSVTISASGAYAGYVWLHEYPIFASDCSVIEGNDDVDIQIKPYSDIDFDHFVVDYSNFLEKSKRGIDEKKLIELTNEQLRKLDND